ncbi:hypothetical protein D3878_03580 [Noviherbaspirillum sedimenti]|uniref:Lipoprotein SmpA/OmlA domain-containing protein n=1 Tax=Noviherbaspirillum sedimenti TaxID=2320865 RepID=A0A3A3GT85_9BURK|nr:hypothetical protein D3878_03580 [Noviherbaspirillum sedimenti]
MTAGAALALAVVLSGACSLPQPVRIGDSQAQVLAARGAPTHRYRLGNEELLEYMYGPYGQETWMARIGADGKLTSFEQVLSDEKFATIRIGGATKQDVLHVIGAPSEQVYFPLSQLEAWTYPYKQYGIWNSLMHVHFDRAGIVRKMENTPDLRYQNQGNVFGFPW